MEQGEADSYRKIFFLLRMVNRRNCLEDRRMNMTTCLAPVKEWSRL